MNRAQCAALDSARWAAVGLGFSIPISVVTDNVLVTSFVLLWLASGALPEKARTMRNHRVALAALAFAGFMVLGMVWSPLPLPELRHAAADALRFVLLAALMTAFVDPKTRERAQLAFLASSALILFISFVLWSGIVDGLPGIKGRPDYPVVFKYHITHNVLMAVAALLFTVRAVRCQRQRDRIILWCLAAAAAINVFLLIPGRTGQLALAAAIAYLALVRLRWRGMTATAVALAALATATWLMPTSVMHERAVKAWEEAHSWRPGEAQSDTSSVGLRLEFYRNSLRMIGERPLIGAGTGAFRTAYEAEVKGSGMVVTDHPHNAFLLVGVELGLAGLAMLIALLAVQWHSAGSMIDPGDRAAARGLVLIFVVAGLVSSTFSDHTEGLFFAWASAALFAGARARP